MRFKSVGIKKMIKKRKFVKKVGKRITNLSKDGLQYLIFFKVNIKSRIF